MHDSNSDIEDLIPNRDVDSNFDAAKLKSSIISAEEDKKARKLNSIELTRIKAREIRALHNSEVYDGNEYKSEFIKKEVEERDKRRKEALQHVQDTSPIVFVNKSDAELTGTTRLEVTKLLTSLNINTNIQLTKTDTHNLLATLLTCNESQLNALYANKKVPLAIKTVIKRLIDDSTEGNIATIERLWNRIFGTGDMNIKMPEGYSGVIPNQPVSREAYILIRETLIGKG